MQLKMMKGKLHRATVTQADLHYEGSVTIDPDLLESAGMLPHESVQIFNITNGERIETYTLEGQRGSREICINGAAAHLVREGDLVIIAAFAWMDEDEARGLVPKVVLLDGENNPR